MTLKEILQTLKRTRERTMQLENHLNIEISLLFDETMRPYTTDVGVAMAFAAKYCPLHWRLIVANSTFQAKTEEWMAWTVMRLAFERLARPLSSTGESLGRSASETRRVAAVRVGAPVPAFREPGRAGGLARADSLSPERRREIAKLAADTRWGNQE